MTRRIAGIRAASGAVLRVTCGFLAGVPVDFGGVPPTSTALWGSLHFRLFVFSRNLKIAALFVDWFVVVLYTVLICFLSVVRLTTQCCVGYVNRAAIFRLRSQSPQRKQGTGHLTGGSIRFANGTVNAFKLGMICKRNDKFSFALCVRLYQFNMETAKAMPKLLFKL